LTVGFFLSMALEVFLCSSFIWPLWRTSCSVSSPLKILSTPRRESRPMSWATWVLIRFSVGQQLNGLNWHIDENYQTVVTFNILAIDSPLEWIVSNHTILFIINGSEVRFVFQLKKGQPFYVKVFYKQCKVSATGSLVKLFK